MFAKIFLSIKAELMIALVLSLVFFGVFVSTPKASAVTQAELQVMIAQLMAQITALNQTALPIPSTDVPVGKTGGSAVKFASFEQAENNDLVVDHNSDLLTGKIKSVKYDRNLNKVVLYVTPGVNNDMEEPWLVFDDANINVNGFTVRSVDLEESANWTKVSEKGGIPVYAITIYKGNIKLPAGSAHTFKATVDVRDGVDGDTWKMWIPKNGITTWSQATKHVSYGPSRVFTYVIEDGEGDRVDDVVMNSMDNNAKAVVTESGAYGVYRFEFEITNGTDGDMYLPTDMSTLGYVGRPYSDDSFVNYSIQTAEGKVIDGYKIEGVTTTLVSTAKNVNQNGSAAYVINEGETEEFTLTVNYEPEVDGIYRVSLESPLRYSPDQVFHDENDKTVTFNESDYKTATIFLRAQETTTPVISQYTLTDISSVTKKLVDPVKGAIDDEYTLYTITLKAGKIFEVKVYGMQTVATRDAQFKKTGYTGVVTQLMAMAKETVVPVVVKPTPRFNGVTYPVGTGNAAVSAVFTTPVVRPTVTGPVEVGRISWGDTPTSSPVMALVSGSQITVELKHTYKKNGVYTISLIGIDKKIVTQKVTVTLPVVLVTPNKNNFGCNRTIATKIANGSLGCYGIWDYSESFGGDINMCQDKNGVDKIGCVIKAPVCASGTARATVNYSNASLPTIKMATISANLKTTADVVKKEVAGIWEYTCVATSLVAVDSGAVSSSSAGVVKGASTDIYSEISGTLDSISQLLGDLK